MIPAQDNSKYIDAKILEKKQFKKMLMQLFKILLSNSYVAEFNFLKNWQILRIGKKNTKELNRSAVTLHYQTGHIDDFCRNQLVIFFNQYFHHQHIPDQHI